MRPPPPADGRKLALPAQVEACRSMVAYVKGSPQIGHGTEVEVSAGESMPFVAVDLGDRVRRWELPLLLPPPPPPER
jgi:hypothetical protein